MKLAKIVEVFQLSMLKNNSFAKNAETLKTAVVGVNKGDGKVMLIPVMAKNKNKVK